MLKLRRNQTGDTIVEVLIAIAIVSVVLVGAYVTTNKNIQSTQDAQERTQAVKLVESQIEYLRAAGTIASGDCFNAGSAQIAAGAQGTNPCIITASGAIAGASVQPAYDMKITTGGNGVYIIEAKWDTVNGSGKSNVTMYYRPVS